MTPVILDGTVYLGLLVCIILLATMVAILTKVMVETRHYVQMHGLDLGNVLSNLRDLIIMRTGNMYNSLSERFDSVDHVLYNSRKRECESLRRQTAQANRMMVMDASIIALANEFARIHDELEQRGTASFVALNSQLLDMVTLIKRGNKDQQEIKTRLAWDKKRDANLVKNLKGMPVVWVGDKSKIPAGWELIGKLPVKNKNKKTK